jgi:hypothetical protein
MMIDIISFYKIFNLNNTHFYECNQTTEIIKLLTKRIV